MRSVAAKYGDRQPLEASYIIVPIVNETRAVLRIVIVESGEIKPVHLTARYKRIDSERRDQLAIRVPRKELGVGLLQHRVSSGVVDDEIHHHFEPVRSRLMLFNDISHYQDTPRRTEPGLSKWWDPPKPS